MTRDDRLVTVEFTGASGNRLIADQRGASGAPVLLLHGGGQTRHAWGATADAIAQNGYAAYAMDQRGHGDSEWPADGHYAFADFADDATEVARDLRRRHGEGPVAVGASLGGIAALLAQGRQKEKIFSALVLVDITPRVDPDGVAKVHGFMRAHSSEGFATIADAAQAVADYLPHRPRPKNDEGLKKNLRRSADGRWRWHWDPRFLDGPRTVAKDHQVFENELAEAAKRISIPALLVRGASSELVKEEHLRDFLALVPHARYVDVSGARHMVAGDRNDAFSGAVLDFLAQMRAGAA
jgi:pimeloyl-ACP methyl ester carboxylesterase